MFHFAGEMIVTKPVDIELFDPAEISCDSGGVATIALVVMAQDNGSTPLNSTVDVTITVEVNTVKFNSFKRLKDATVPYKFPSVGFCTVCAMTAPLPVLCSL